MENKSTPEETELHQKEEVLSQKQAALTELELSYATIQASLHSFEIEYFLKVGQKYVALDQLQADFDKILASKAPHDSTANKNAKESRARAEQSGRDAEEFAARKDKWEPTFQSTPELKALYRELAKLLHPDLTLDVDEKARRHLLMQQINEAYQHGDLKSLQDILDSERSNPENIKGDDVGSALVRVIRKIAQVDKRVSKLESQIDELKRTDLYVLFETVQNELKNGIDLLQRMGSEIDSRILFLQREIDKALT
jgi:hypothetical protein